MSDTLTPLRRAMMQYLAHSDLAASLDWEPGSVGADMVAHYRALLVAEIAKSLLCGQTSGGIDLNARSIAEHLVNDLSLTP